jgi:hypothetical protein
MKHIVLGIVLIFLASCEGFIHVRGTVVDARTNKPLENVAVKLNGRVNCQVKCDTIPPKERKKLRKQGVKDNFMSHANGECQYSYYGPSVSDDKGSFKVGTMLVGCSPVCPKITLSFTKDGYKPLTFTTKEIYQDSALVRLEPLE